MDIIYFILSFILGIITTLLFKRFVNVEISIKQKQPTKKLTQVQKSANPKIKCVNQMLQELNKNGNLPINLSGAVLMSLKEIGNTKNWDEKLDAETIENLYKIYQKWQRHIKGNNKKVVKLADAGGFNELKYWEGTLKEYTEAYEQGLIDENTEVQIIEDDKDYHGSWIAIDNDGQIEEYME